jgi:hypothetical protein
MSASLLFKKDRRMEAESYLSDGFQIRHGITKRDSGWTYMSDFAKAWQPSRLAGTVVSPEFGTPFLAATQVFDIRPAARKFLSLEQTDNAAGRFVDPGTILLTCSGTVGRATLAQNSLAGVLISHDILRIDPVEKTDWGWLYAYLRAPLIIKLMQSAQYGHVIKHLETAHVDRIPVISVSDTLKEHFLHKTKQVLENRNRAEALTREAEELLSDLLTPNGSPKADTPYTSISASGLFGERRRLEAAFHSVDARSLIEALEANSARIDKLADLVERVWWMTRFSRNFGDDGVPYRSSDDLFAISQVTQKRVYLEPIPNAKDFFVKAGWLLMACSGQIYGLNGSVTLATEYDENFFFSHDLIRIAPSSGAIRSGYLFAYLGHPKIGQVLVKRNAYGSSVPHIDPGDVERIPVARLSHQQEDEIADLAEEASRLRAEADHIEREIGDEADEIIRKFIR